MEQLELYIPGPEDLWFYQKMLSDPDTMSYNRNWDVGFDGYDPETGCICIPDEKLADFYAVWAGKEPEYFFAYIKRSCDGIWIGEVNFNYVPEQDWWDSEIVLHAPYRGRGYGVPALKLLLDHAFRECGVSQIHNTFELARNEASAWETYRKAGFRELGADSGFLHMAITREEYLHDNPRPDGPKIKLYHISDSLRLGDEVTLNYAKTASLIQPFVQALEKSEDCFYAMILNGKYLQAVLGKEGLTVWSNYAKWATEGAFEFIRKTEFPHCVSRIRCNYFCADPEECRRYYEFDWGSTTEEARARVHLYEMELDAEGVDRRDMRIYDEAYSAMKVYQDVGKVLACARRYFAGEQSARPLWELLSDKPARAVEDLTHLLRNQEPGA